MKEFNPDQVAQLKEIAAQLRDKRQEVGVSLDEIAVKTFIPLRLLEAIDQGQIDRLPEPVFVQGFLRRYADAIGLDGMAVARAFSLQPQSPEPTQTPAPTPTPVERSSAGVGSVDPPPLASPHQSFETKPQRSRPVGLLLGIAAFLLVGAGAIALLSQPRKISPEVSSSEAPVDTSSPTPPVEATPSPSVAAASPSPTLSPSAQPSLISSVPVQVAISITGDKSWMQIEVDGKPEFEGTLNKGEQKTLTAQKKLFIRAGNAGAVSVSYNQGEQKTLGSPGEIKEMTYTAKGESTAGNP